MKHSVLEIETLQDKHLILLLDNNVRGGISRVMGDRYVNSGEKSMYRKKYQIRLGKESICTLCKNLIQKKVKLDCLLNTPVDSDKGYFIEGDLSYPDDIKDKTTKLPGFPGNTLSPQGNFSDYLSEMNQKSYTQNELLICDWNKKKQSCNS